MSAELCSEPDREQPHNFPLLNYSTVLVELPNGQIRTETGADGVWLMFDAPCLECLPYCKAHCCSCAGILLTEEEAEDYTELKIPISFNQDVQGFEMQKSADGFCAQLDRQSRTCSIYQNRPQTCSTFHCTRGHLQRGWKLSNAPNRLSVK